MFTDIKPHLTTDTNFFNNKIRIDIDVKSYMIDVIDNKIKAIANYVDNSDLAKSDTERLLSAKQTIIDLLK